MDKVLISVVVPVYNGEKFIERCITSILRQTYKEIELIIVDDGSVDNTAEIIKKLVIKDNRIKCFRQNNNGVSSARNLGLEHANGKYLYFVDSDDWIESSMIMENYLLINSGNYDLIINDFFYNKNNYQTISHTFDVSSCEISVGDIRKKLLVADTLNSQCICMYKLDLIRENGIIFFEDLACGEDNIFNLNYSRYVKKGFYTRTAYYHYEIHENSGCRKLYNNQLEMLKEQTYIKLGLNNEWELLSNGELNELYQLILTQLSAYTFLAYKQGKWIFYQWLNNMYSSELYSFLIENYNNKENQCIPKSYKLICRLLISKRYRLIYIYCFFLNLLV